MYINNCPRFKNTSMAAFGFKSYIQIIHKLSVIFGISTERHNKIWIFILLWFFLQIILTGYNIQQIVERVNVKFISKATDTILLVLSTFYIMTIWFYGIYYKNEYGDFILKMEDCEKCFKELYGNIKLHETVNTLIKYRLIYYFSIYIILITFICVLWSTTSITLHWVSYVTPILLTSAFSLRFAMYVNMIKWYLKYLNKDMKNLYSLAVSCQLYIREMHRRPRRNETKNVIMVLTRISRLHHKLCGQITVLSNIYGSVLVMMVALSFTSLVIGVRYSFNIYQGHMEEKRYSIQVLAIFFIGELAFICGICNSTVEEVNKTGTLIHKIELKEELKDEIEIFSLQIANEKVEFNAAGFFTVNYKLLLSIVGGAMTYIIILIQLSTLKT